MSNELGRGAEGAEKSLLIVDDDKVFGQRLTRAFETRGYSVRTAFTCEDGRKAINEAAPAYAIVDLRLGDGNGLDVIRVLRDSRPDARAIVLTGYANIASAVTAVKIGAVDYLPKPADADDVEAALLQGRGLKAIAPKQTLSPDQVKWEHIQRVFHLHDGNIADTARALNIHRRTLQRMLDKRAPRAMRAALMEQN